MAMHWSGILKDNVREEGHRTPGAEIYRSTENRLILGRGKEHRKGQEEMEGNCDGPTSPLGCSGLSQVKSKWRWTQLLKCSSSCEGLKAIEYIHLTITFS